MKLALRFSALYHKLSDTNILTRKSAVLHFLNCLSDQANAPHVLVNPVETALSVMGLKSIKAHPEFPTLPTSFPSAPAAEFNPNEQEPDITLQKPRGPCNGYYLLGGRDGSTILSLCLLRDMLFIFQDIDGKFIKFDVSADAYVIIENKLDGFTEEFKKVIDGWTGGADVSNEGLIRQGFCVGIQKELVRHFELIAQLEDQFTKVDFADDQDYASKGLSLKRLLVWITEPLLKLRLISVLVDLSAGLRGGALLSMIHGYTNHGDPFVQEFVEGLLKEVSVPFYQMLRRWLYEGELNDPYQEFFVVHDRNVDKNNMWRNQYVLRSEMIPSFFNRSCYLIGKSLNFIRYCCGEESYVIKRSQELVSAPLGFLEYGDTTQLEKSITVAYKDISAHILDLMFGKYKLMTHLQALKKYLLLGQGDFVQNLMDKLGSDLSKPANGILRHNLTGILESSIRASNAQHDDPDVLRRLDVRLLEISAGDSGWDVFTLDYHTDSPISTVFPSQSMHQYMKLFTFLWRLKRVEHTLSASWKKGMTEYIVFSKLKDIGQHFHLSNVVISEMIHFTYQLQYYILFEVLECSWNELNVYLDKRTGDLDQLIGAHNKGLLAATTSSNQNMFSMLIGLFDVILKFQLAVEGMVDIGFEVLEAAKKSDSKAFESRLMQRISSIHDTRLNVSQPSSEPLACTNRFRWRKRILQALLNALSSHPDANLHGLRVQLDYNSFYKGKGAASS
ncbi:Spc98 family-domain-containing protein [Obelidium mucronatum]|nr:Spc98 family-domain-containing protein [Obelidium mucronatum]